MTASKPARVISVALTQRVIDGPNSAKLSLVRPGTDIERARNV